MLQQLIDSLSLFFRLYQHKPIALSFDITDACNLNCPYCYWQETRERGQLSTDEIVGICKEYRKMGIPAITLVGGEPTLRPDVIEEVDKIFSIVWVVTNGTLLPKMNFDIFSLHNTNVILSLDGVGAVHDRSHGRKGLYDELKAFYWDKPILTTTTLHNGNKKEPAKLLGEWSQSGIKGMTFDFATPVGRASSFHLIGKERDSAIDELLALKISYGSFMKNSEFALSLHKQENMGWSARCPLMNYVISLDAKGRRKTPCVIGSSREGKKPVCSQCGCHVPSTLLGLKAFDKQSIQAARWFL